MDTYSIISPQIGCYPFTSYSIKNYDIFHIFHKLLERSQNSILHQFPMVTLPIWRLGDVAGHRHGHRHRGLRHLRHLRLGCQGGLLEALVDLVQRLRLHLGSSGGKSAGDFAMSWGFPVFFPVNQSIENRNNDRMMVRFSGGDLWSDNAEINRISTGI